jgi:CheY-like chemotaxis protein
VESTEGAGSTFHFTIVAAAAASAAPLTALAGRRLLVVATADATRDAVRRHAASWGMHVRLAGSAEEACAWLRRGDPLDVVLADTDAVDRIGADTKRPIVLLASLGSAAVHDSSVEVVVRRPVRASALLEAFQSALGIETAAPVSPAAPSERARRPLRILLAEDNPVNQRLALMMLERIGYGASLAETGTAAIAAVERAPYDVVLMDVEMPEMSGLEASREIHRRLGRARPRIVAMTANATDAAREACLAAGMDDYLTKPVRLQDLAEALERALEIGGLASRADGLARAAPR